MLIFRYFKESKSCTYQNQDNKKLASIESNYIGYVRGDMFSGIQTVKPINVVDGKVAFLPEERPSSGSLPISSGMILLSQLCGLLPLLAIVSLVVGTIFLVIYFTQNIFVSLGSFIIAIAINLVIIVLGSLFETFFLVIIPKRNGWLQAYIDDYGTISVPDEKSGKTIPFTLEFEGKKRIHMVSEKESKEVWDAVFSKKK